MVGALSPIVFGVLGALAWLAFHRFETVRDGSGLRGITDWHNSRSSVWNDIVSTDLIIRREDWQSEGGSVMAIISLEAIPFVTPQNRGRIDAYFNRRRQMSHIGNFLRPTYLAVHIIQQMTSTPD